MLAFRHGQDTPHESQNGIRLRINFHAVAAPHLDPAEDEDRAEDVDHPMEALQKRDAGEDHRRAHDERAENSPKKHAMPIERRHLEVSKEQRKDEDIVHAQGELDQVAGQELQRRVLLRG